MAGRHCTPLDLTPSLSFYLSSRAAVRSLGQSFDLRELGLDRRGINPSEAAFREATSVPVRPVRLERMDSFEEERVDDGVSTRRVIPSRLQCQLWYRA